MKGTVYYIGFYGEDKEGKRNNLIANPAGTVKMNFIINCLKELGYRIIILCITYDNSPGIHKQKKVVVDDREEYIYLPYFSLKINGKLRGQKKSSMYALKQYMTEQFTKESLVITYHSLFYENLIRDIHQKVGFKWISQVEELYNLSRKDYYNKDALETEESYFIDADGFLFVNDILPERYAFHKPYAVSYGTYDYFGDNKKSIDGLINVTYTGIVNEDRGIYRIIDAFNYLPKEYKLNILGFGSEENMQKMFSMIQKLNFDAGYDKAVFFGTKMGKDYSDFLLQNQIGISLMDTSDVVSQNAFPSKIMAYLGHSLYVVSSKCESIVKSKVAGDLIYCGETPEEIAEAVLSIKIGENHSMKERIQNLKKDFCTSLDDVLTNV